jgi:hypothetical protein
MNHRFDELTKSLAQSVTRRAALKKFGVGLAGMALACLGLAPRAEAGPGCSDCLKSCKAAGLEKCNDVCQPWCGKPPRWV